MNYTMKKRFEDDVSNFTTPAHSRQASNDYYQPLNQTPILARLTQELNQDHNRTILETDEPDEGQVRLDALTPHHTRSVSEVLSSGHYRSDIPEEYRAYGDSNTVQYQSNYRNFAIVERSAEDIIHESVRETYFRNYAGDLARPPAVVSAERRNASSHLNLHESIIADVVWADMKADLFLEIPIIRENTFENPWSYEKFLDRRTHLVRSDSDHTLNVNVRSEVNLAQAQQLIQARYFSERLLESVDISSNQVGEKSEVLLLSEKFSPRSLHFLLYCGKTHGATDYHLTENVVTNAHHHQNSSSHIGESITVTTTSVDRDYTYVPAATTVATHASRTVTAGELVQPTIPIYTPVAPYDSYDIKIQSTVVPDATTTHNYSISFDAGASSYTPMSGYDRTYVHTEEVIHQEPVTTNVTTHDSHIHRVDEAIQTSIPIYRPVAPYENHDVRIQSTVVPAATTTHNYSTIHNTGVSSYTPMSGYDRTYVHTEEVIHEQPVTTSVVYDEPAVLPTTSFVSHHAETDTINEEVHVESTNHFSQQSHYVNTYEEIHEAEVTHESTPYTYNYESVTTTTAPAAGFEISSLYDEILSTMTHTQFPLHTVTHVHTSEEHVEHVRPTLEPVIEETVVITTDNSVDTLREQLQTCEERLRQKEVHESLIRHDLELRSQQDRDRCKLAEANILSLTAKLEACERRCREESSVQTTIHQAVLEEKDLRQRSEAEIVHLRAQLAEYEQTLAHERSVQSANFLEMQQRAEREHATGQQYATRFVNLQAKFTELEKGLKLQQELENNKRLTEERKYQEIHQQGQEEIAALKFQLRSYEQRVQQESIDISAFKAQEAELARRNDYIARRERDLRIQLTEYDVRHSQELNKIKEEEERLRRELSSLQLAKTELERVHAHSQTSIREEHEMYQRELALSNERLRKQSMDLKLKNEEIDLLKKQLEESKQQKERIYDEVHDDNQGSPRGRRGNLQFETFETKTVIQRSTREYAVDENDYEEIGGYKKQEHIYEEPKTTAVNKVVYAEADTTENHKRHLIDVTLPKTSINVGVSVGGSGSEHKFEKNIYEDVATTDLTIGTGAGVSSNKIISMSKRNNWGDNEVSSTTGHHSAIPHVESIPPPLNITPLTVGRGVEVTDESGRKHTAVRVDQTSYSPKEHHNHHHGLVEKARLRYEEVLKNNSPSYSSSGASHTFEKEVSDNMVTSTEEVFKQEVTVVESVNSPYTIENRPHVADLRRQFELGSNRSSPVPSPSPARHVLSPAPSNVPTHQAPSPTPSHEGTGRRHVTRSVNNYVSSEVKSYYSSGSVPPIRPEPIYDNVAAEEEPIYDTIADQEEPIQRSWAVDTYATEKSDNHRSTMTDLDYHSSNGHIPNNVEKFSKEESQVLHEWDPRPLVHELYSISYEPRLETKKTRYPSMEGHVEVPSEETKTVAELEREWKQQYMRTKEGRLQVFVSHCAEEAPENEYVLSGCDIDVNREERTLRIKGGPKKLNIVIRVPSNVFDKWRQSLASHSAASQTDAYVTPIPRSLPHINKHIVIIELGSCSIRGGILNQEPSLPQSFFPAIAVKMDDGRLVVGADAYAPEVRHHGEFICPIQAHNPSLERYTLNKDVVIACMKKVVSDLAVDPSRHEVLLSIPQNIPNTLIGELATIALHDIGFKGAAITRQSSLILYAYGVETGVVVDIGDRLNIVPIFDGYVVDSAIVSIPYGATQVREALRANLCSNNRGLYSFQSPVEKLILRYVMEQTSYVAENYAEEEQANHSEVNVSLEPYNMPPSAPNTFNIDGSRFTCTEGFFNPKKWGLESKSLHHLVHDAVSLSPIDSRRNLMKNIFLAGGATLLPGLAARLEQELSSIAANTIHTQVHISPWRYSSAYLGAQKLAEKPGFEDMCVTRDTLGRYLDNLSRPQN